VMVTKSLSTKPEDRMSSVPEMAAQPLPVIQPEQPAEPASVAQPDSPAEAPALLKIDQAEVHKHLDALVRQSVEDTLNALLDAEADRLCGAKRYERSPERLDSRAGHYSRQLHTKAGPVSLRVPKLRNLPFETAIIERYRRRETSVEEALVEMYLAGVSTR